MDKGIQKITVTSLVTCEAATEAMLGDKKSELAGRVYQLWVGDNYANYSHQTTVRIHKQVGLH